MKKQFLKDMFVSISLALMVSYLFSLTNAWKGGPQIYEPKIGAVHHGHHGSVSVTRNNPVNFGSLVGGGNRWIKLSASGNISSDFDISSQSDRSYIGDDNMAQFSTVQPGRLTFTMHLSCGRTARVRILTGLLETGVSLSNVEILDGPEMEGVNRVRSASDEVSFEGTICSSRRSRGNTNRSNVTIDLIYGGQLTLDSAISGQVQAPLNVNITKSSLRHVIHQPGSNLSD